MSAANHYQQVTILLVDDDDVDYMAVQRAMRQLRLLNPLVRARDGIEALTILTSLDTIKGPYLILLDLNMPRMNGFEFLERIRSDPSLSSSVVFMLTTSSTDEDRMKAYSHHVAGYMVKTDMKDGFNNIFNMLEGYWRIVELPSA
ncbi:response regulator [Shewanella sp. NKUCC05_KAH]|jgi:CheY-like chemotaxis protein|uniref:Response regulator n=2 Tax=Shewanella TaxID=22 RepID=A0AA50Q673_9GAMM|nr:MULTISPECIES: response regulator [Shewanella]RBP82272.1 CheY-like chemotaxis protein [Shewanella putrefaciens]AVI65259.1 two-component system response regulator [Shewanella sp. WE21]MBI1673244.1 response regulator [Shewanella sp. DW31]MBP6520137.1 response regulator [Shewanella sp.]MBP7663406.1 response regulator [Shewanella sp.]